MLVRLLLVICDQNIRGSYLVHIRRAQTLKRYYDAKLSGPGEP